MNKPKDRKRRFYLNTKYAILNKIVTVVCGLILPPLILRYYGSDVNGLINSIAQYLSFANLMDLGISTVVQSSLYEPLASGDVTTRDGILKASRKFFNVIGMLFILYTSVLMVLYPNLIKPDFGIFSTALLIAAISISSVSEYILGVTNQAFLAADQKDYIQQLIRIFSTILNTLISVVLIKNSVNIIFVKLSSSLVFSIRPILLEIYVRKHYNIDYRITYKENPIKQRWNGFAHHLASFIFGNTDVVLLTAFSSLRMVSVYSIYSMIVTGINGFYATALSGAGALMGDLYARKETDKLQKSFAFFEWISHIFTTLVFSDVYILIVPFVLTYTKGVTDVNYKQDVFAAIITLAYGICCVRNIYNKLIISAGKFKETQTSSILEALINIVISLILVKKFSLVGVAIGTLCGVLYQQIYYYYYLHKNIVFEDIHVYLKQLVVDLFEFLIICFISRFFSIANYTYFYWCLYALLVLVISIVVVLLVNVLFYKKLLQDTATLLSARLKNKHK